MVKRKTIVYWMILAAVLLLVWAGISIGDARAHYQNTTSWYTVMPPTAPESVTGDCLVSGGQTILLGRMDLTEREVPFTLQSTGVVSGTLSWSTNHADHLQVEMLLNGEVHPAGEALMLEAGEKTIVMKLIPTQLALETIHDSMDIRIDVAFTTGADSITGTFQVTMPENTQVPEPSEPEPSEPEPSEPEASEPMQPEMTDPTESATQPVDDPAEPKTTEPTDPVTTEPTAPAATVPTDPVTTEPTGPATTEPGDPTATEPSGPEETDPTSPPDGEGGTVDQESSPVQLASLPAFSPAHTLPVLVTFPENTLRLTLQLADAQGSGTQFPAYTRYSPDGGTNWFLLYYGGVIGVERPSGTQALVLLDLSGITLDKTAGVVLCAEAFGEDLSLGTARLTAMPDVVLDTQPKLLTEKTQLEIGLPPAWKDCPMTYEVTMLTVDETGKRMVYVPVELSAQTLEAVLETGEEKNTLTLRIGTGEELPPAGTYRITFTWTYEDICFATAQMSFFINYASDAAL